MMAAQAVGASPRAGTSAAALVAALGFLLVAILLALPILLHPYLPLIDLPNHIARHYIAANEGGPLARFYDYGVSLTPNSAADLAFLLLGDPADPVGFSQVLMAVYAVALVASAMLLSRVAWGRWSPWPLASALVAYNTNFFWGFQNFLLAIPVAVAVLALWLATEERPTWQRLAILGPAVTLVYLFHFFAFVFLAFATFGREAQLLLVRTGPVRTSLRRGLTMSLAFVVPLAWLASSVLAEKASPAGNFTRGKVGYEWLDVFGSLAIARFDDLGTGVNLTGCLVTVALFAMLAILLRPGRVRLRLAPALMGPVIAVAIATVLAPSWLNGVAWVHVRLPFVLVLIVIAGSRWEGLRPRSAAAIGAIVLALVAARSATFERLSAVHNADMGDLTATLADLPLGARLMPLARDGDNRVWHVQAYAVVQRQAFVPTLFQGVHSLLVLPEWRNASIAAGRSVPIELAMGILDPDEAPTMRLAPQERAFLEDWPEEFDYVLLTGPIDGPAEELPSWLRPVSSSGRYALFEIGPRTGSTER